VGLPLTDGVARSRVAYSWSGQWSHAIGPIDNTKP